MDESLPLLVEPETLHRHLGDPDLLVVDLCRPQVHAQAHLPGAVPLLYSELVRAEPPAMGLLPHPHQLAAVFSRLGLTDRHRVVAYDDEGSGRAGRLLWTLEALGHPRVSVLNGGLQAWAEAGLPLESGETSAVGGDYVAALRRPEVLADRDYVLSRLDDPGTVVLDVRSPAEYRGEDVRAARGGHIPGAVNLEWTRAIDRSRALRLQPAETLQALLEERGVTPDREVVVHCQTHHRSSHTYLVLRHLGYPRVRGYAGSWSEWGNDPDMPVVTGDEPR